MGESTKSDLSKGPFFSVVEEDGELDVIMALWTMLERIYRMKNQEKQINALNLWLTLVRHLIDKTYIGPPRNPRTP